MAAKQKASAYSYFLQPPAYVGFFLGGYMPKNKPARKSRNVSNVERSGKQDNTTNNASTLLEQLKIKLKVEVIFQLVKQCYQWSMDLINNLPS